MNVVPSLLRKKKSPVADQQVKGIPPPAAAPAAPAAAPSLIGQQKSPVQNAAVSVPPAAPRAPAGPDPVTGAPAAPPGGGNGAANAERLLSEEEPTGPGGRPGTGVTGPSAEEITEAIQNGTGAAMPGLPAAPGTTVWDKEWGETDFRDEDAAGDLYAERDARIASIIDRLLASEADTAEGEDIMQQQNDRLFGEQLVNQRAALGRSMGGGGGAAALEGDLRSRNALDFSDRLLDYRTEEDQRAKDNALDAIGAELDMREGGRADDLMRRRIDLLDRLIEQDGEPADPVQRGSEGGGGNKVTDPKSGMSWEVRSEPDAFWDERTGTITIDGVRYEVWTGNYGEYLVKGLQPAG